MFLDECSENDIKYVLIELKPTPMKKKMLSIHARKMF